MNGLKFSPVSHLCEVGTLGGPHWCCTKTKHKGLTDPQGDQKGEVGSQVEGDEAKAGYKVAQQEHPLPPQYLTGRDAR